MDATLSLRPAAPVQEPMCDLDRSYTPCEFRIKQAVHAWEQRDAHALRRAVFCVEQGLFVGDDRDAIDAHAQTLVAMTCLAGQPDQVIGTVRIHRPFDLAPEAGQPDAIWWGSRLAVHAAFRSFGRIGATLIRLAVSSAHAQGCEVFLAHVQSQNVPLFERLHWRSLRPEMLHGRPHQLMQADLAAYPPCERPFDGFVTQARGRA